jgi:hypothetical protein
MSGVEYLAVGVIIGIGVAPTGEFLWGRWEALVDWWRNR